MWASRVRESGPREVRRDRRAGLRRARAALRLHGKVLVALLLAAGIVLMALHWS